MKSLIQLSIATLLGTTQLAHAESAYLYTYTGAHYTAFRDATYGNPGAEANNPFTTALHFTFSFVSHSPLAANTDYRFTNQQNLGLGDDMLGWKSDNGVHAFYGTDSSNVAARLRGYLITGEGGRVSDWGIDTYAENYLNQSFSDKGLYVLPNTEVFDRVGQANYVPTFYWNEGGSAVAGVWSSESIAELPTWARPYNPTTPVPEPATYAMLMGGLGVVAALARRRRRAASMIAQA